MKHKTISVTTNGDGDGSGTSSNITNGKLYAIKWNVGTCDAGVDITVSTINSEAASNLLVVANANASKMYYPRTLQHLDTDGSALTTHCQQFLSGTLNLVIAQGGDTKTGSVVISYED